MLMVSKPYFFLTACQFQVDTKLVMCLDARKFAHKKNYSTNNITKGDPKRVVEKSDITIVELAENPNILYLSNS